ncbi:DUF6512 family protein [Proteiniclasticum sp. C24MP]|uniref:DUF6512 family protein n=1 Tax=Proteiniclasticum sp. C24MP TaxID=3374101 RepID=UPI003754F2DF
MNMYIRSERTEQSVRFVRIYHLIGIFVILSIAGPLHFAYEWSGENFFVSLVAPVNESIWEHLKMVYWPTLLWWVLGYALFRKRSRLSGMRWAQSMAVSIIFGMLVIVLWYYTWAGAIGIEASWVNFSSMISVVIGQLLAMHVYRVTKPRWVYFMPGMIIVVSLAFMSGFFTYYPPSLPMFVSPY